MDIYLKFIGKFDVPLPEPTPEELAEAERRRKRRTYAHEWYQRNKAKKQQAALSADQSRSEIP